MKQPFLLFLLIFSCGSCIQKKKPLSDEKVVEVIADLLVADEIIVNSYPDERDDYRIMLKKQILAIHDLDESEFDSVFTVVQMDLLRYFEIQNKVEERLEKMKENQTSFWKTIYLYSYSFLMRRMKQNDFIIKL